jgi:DNA polymerase-3 subunit beta
MLPESDVRVKQLPDAWVAIECERSSFKMAGLPREDYPALPEPKGSKKGVELPAAALRDLIARTAFAITAEDARYYLAGALLVLEKDAVGMVATDGHRLAFAQRRVALKGADAPSRVLVPRKAIHELGRLLEGDDAVLFQESENHLLFSVGGRTLASKTIEGQFPAYEKVVAVAADKHATLDRELFAMAIRRVSLLSSERSRAVKLALQNGRLELLASAPELGEAQESLPAEYKGDSVEIGFNAQYLLDFLAAAGSPSVTLDVKDAESQGMLKPNGDSETDYRYVVMPMRL